MASPALTDDEEQFAVPDNAPHLNDWTKVGLYVVIFAILGVNIWGIVDTSHYKYTPTTSSTNIYHNFYNHSRNDGYGEKYHSKC